MTEALDPLKNALNEEIWLCAGQSNIQKGWGELSKFFEDNSIISDELQRLNDVDVRFWDFNDGKLRSLNSENALDKCALGVSFAIRRAETSKKRITILYVAAGGAPTESFLSKDVMCTKNEDGSYKYPRLAAIANNHNSLDKNEDFPCVWVRNEYPKCRANLDEGRWWKISSMYEQGIRLLVDIPLTGILWYQGESNATTCEMPDKPTPNDYQKESLFAVVEQLLQNRNIPFLMMGLPIMNRPWEPYRLAQKEVCEATGAIYVDTFSAGLGELNNVHPYNKMPFAELAARCVNEYFTKKGAV